MSTPRVSVILPVYNDERFVEGAIRSILAQTFADFELLVVNDGSTDGTARVLDRIRDARLRVMYQENQGISAALNRMIVDSRGEYVARMDSDDTADPRRFAMQVDFLDRNPTVGLLGSACDIADEQGHHVAHFGVPLTDRAIRRRMPWVNPMVHSSVMMRRSVLSEVGLYDPRLGRLGIEDYDLWWRILAVSAAANLEDRLVRRVHRQGSTCRVAKSRHHASMMRVKLRALATWSAPASTVLGLGFSAGKWAATRICELAPRSVRPLRDGS